MGSGRSARLILVVVAVAGSAFVAIYMRGLSQKMSTAIDATQTQGLQAAASTGDAPFVLAWSVSLSLALVHEMAVSPGGKGEFFALYKDEIHRFDAGGRRVAQFAAPPKSTRIASDPTGAMPYLIVVSSSTKWTGAIDYVETVDYFLHALDAKGREVWRKRFDPTDVSSPEPLIAKFNSSSVVVLGASKRIFAFDQSGRELWNIPFWHHFGAVAATDLESGGILAAQAPMKEIVRISGDGKVVGPWGMGEGPRRLRAINTDEGIFGLSLRHVTGRGQGGRHDLAFFDSTGATIREVELPQNATFPSYAPLVAMDVDGRGRTSWVLATSDGLLLVFSPTGDELARHTTGNRLRGVLSVPMANGPDLLITATYRGLTALRPVPERMHPTR